MFNAAKKEEKIVIDNRVAEYCHKNGIDRRGFIGLCLQSKASYKGRMLTAETAGRVFDGETGIILGTAFLVAKALGVSVEDLFQVE